MTNFNNNGRLIGRLGQPIKRFENPGNGSSTLKVSLLVSHNYVTKSSGTVESDGLSLDVYQAPGTEGLGYWANVGVGDLVGVDVTMTCRSYVKDGKTVYPPVTLQVDGVPQYLEPKAVTTARRERKAAAPATPAAAPAQAVAAAPTAQAPAAQPQSQAEIMAAIEALKAKQAAGPAAAAPAANGDFSVGTPFGDANTSGEPPF